jgi:hypothetical protein
MRGKVVRTGTKAGNRRRGDAVIIRLIIATHSNMAESIRDLRELHNEELYNLIFFPPNIIAVN